MEMPRRHGFKWSINEILRLQREYELLDLSVEEIASRHERTVNGIIQKIIEEDFLYSSDEEEETDDDDEESDHDEDDENHIDLYDDEISYDIYEREHADNLNEDELCITEKKEPLNPGSPQRTIRAYEYLRDSFIGVFFNSTK
jgi:hypothetical protein